MSSHVQEHASQHERHASSSPTISASSVSNASADEQDLSQASSQSSSQPSRIVNVLHDPTHANTQAQVVIAKIEAIMEAMVDVLSAGGDALTIPYRNSRDSPDRPLGSLSFPGRTLNEATKFTRMMRIMELSREALMSGRLITKRNIYYQNPDLFKDQTTVNRLVDDFACTLEIGRNALNIVAASKGLLAGPLRLIMANGPDVCCASDHDHTASIPPISTIRQIDFGNARWILVIEKEATFRTLAVGQFWRDCVQGQGLIVTGKGYADLATLEFLNLLHSLRPNMPIYCVVDCDPHGIDIMRTYKHGSKGLGHEANTRIPGLHWLGVKMDDIFLATNRLSWARESPDYQGSQGSDSQSISQSSAVHFSQASSDSQSSTLGLGPRSNDSTAARARAGEGGERTPLDSLIQLTSIDRKTTQRILQSIVGDDGDEDGDADDDAEPDQEDLEQIRELQMMLMLNMKAEIQAIDDMGDLSSWLDEKMEMG